MTCEVFETRDGTRAIVCSRSVRTKKCQFCSEPAQFECDGPRPKKKSKHCDKRMCEAHCTKVGDVEVSDVVDTIDYCPDCAAKHQDTQ